MYRYVSFGLLISVILLVAFLFYKVMASFILPLFLAALLVVMFRPVHNWFLKKLGGRIKLSALATTLTIMMIVVAPLALLMVLAAAEGRVVVGKIQASMIVDKIESLRSQLNLDFPALEEFADLEKYIGKISIDDTDDHIAQLLELSRIEQELRRKEDRLSIKLQLPVDRGTEATETTSKRTANRWEIPWAQFKAKRNELRQLLANSTTTDTESEKISEAIVQSRDLISDLKTAFTNFKIAYLGGRAWAWLKEMANPSKDELVNYLEEVTDYLSSRLVSFGSATAAYVVRTLFGAAIMIIALYFFLVDGPAMLAAFKGLSPLDDEHEEKLIEEFDKVSRAVVLATLLSAMAQGLLAAIGFYFVGLESVVLLMLLTSLFALIPFVGAAAVWVPVCLYLFLFDGRVGAAILLAIYGVGIVSMADNVIKPLVLHGHSNLHPLWALLSVLGGVAALGPIGILIGPMVVAFLQTLLKILQRELIAMQQAEVPAGDSRYRLIRPPQQAQMASQSERKIRFEMTDQLLEEKIESRRVDHDAGQKSLR